MVVNFEFLDDEAIENVITCMHYKVDKVVLFGYDETIAAKKKSVEHFLTKYCGVKEIETHSISHTDLYSIVDVMRKDIQGEYKAGNQCFFDVTGGEGLTLLAFGLLAAELDVPMHMYDIVKDALIEFDKKHPKNISKNVQPQQVKLDLDKYIEMQGGLINYRLHKGHKGDYTEEELDAIAGIWEVYKEFKDAWGSLSTVIRALGNKMSVNATAHKVLEKVKGQPKIATAGKFSRFLDLCEEHGVMKNVVHANGSYQFTFTSEFVKECIRESGSILEQYAFLEESRKPDCDDCGIGMHLDWDYTLHEKSDDDVYNEIDVISISGNIPTFISCKASEADQKPLYELETVAKRFGGKYAKKVFVTGQIMGDTHKLRAKEMNIEVKEV